MPHDVTRHMTPHTRVLTVNAKHEAGQNLVNELKYQRRVDALERLWGTNGINTSATDSAVLGPLGLELSHIRRIRIRICSLPGFKVRDPDPLRRYFC